MRAACKEGACSAELVLWPLQPCVKALRGPGLAPLRFRFHEKRSTKAALLFGRVAVVPICQHAAAFAQQVIPRLDLATSYTTSLFGIF